MWIAGVVGGVYRVNERLVPGSPSPMRWFEYLYPNSYDSLLLSPDAGKVATGAAALAGIVGLAVLAGSAIFQARDV